MGRANKLAQVAAAYDSGGLVFRNRIINGDGNIAQRASLVSLTSVVSYLAMDRWAARQTGTPNASIFKNTAVVPSGFPSSIQTFRPNGSTATGVIELLQAVESVNSISLQGGPVTLSFFAKAGTTFSATASNIGVSVFSGTGTDQSAASMGGWTGVTQPVNVVQTINTTWTRYSFTGNIPANATQVGVYVSWTPTGTAGADDSVYITGVQLEKGSTATEFDHKPYGTELALCQRYYQRITQTNPGDTFAIGCVMSATSAQGVINPLIAMRTKPAIETTGTAANYRVTVGASNTACSAAPSVDSTFSQDAIVVNFTVASGLTTGQACALRAAASNAYLGFSAEL